MLWATSPACTELETHVLDWLVHDAGPAAEVSFLQQWRRSDSGHGFERVTLCTAGGAGTSDKLCQQPARLRRQAGRLHLVASAFFDREGCADCRHRAGQFAADRGRSRTSPCAPRPWPGRSNRTASRAYPFFVCATVGTTSSNAIDPVPEIARICRENNLWLHVDAAMSGTAALCPEFRYIHEGVESADSYCFNPHKWMFTNFDCDCFYVADRKALIQTLSVLPEYLRNKATESGAVIDYRDWQVPLGRRFRSLKLWFVIRHYGVEGLQFHIRRHIELAQQFAKWVTRDDRFELAAPAPLNLVCFRHKGATS